jgi:MFS superfamily sulfate permease-like transporter
MLIVLAGAIVVSALLDLDAEGVAVVGKLPSALPDPAVPDVGWDDLAALVPAALGMLILNAEAAGVSRAIATSEGYRVDVNRDLVAIGGSNVVAGLSSGFVQSGGASQTMAGEQAGGKTQLSSVVAAGLVLITGAFLTSLFTDLPEATLAAIVIVAISHFFRVDELLRFRRVRGSAFWLALAALAGVLLLGVLPGLLVAVGLSLALVIQRLSRPAVVSLVRDPRSGVWGRSERHPDGTVPAGTLAVGVEGPLFYPNATVVRERLLELVEDADPRPRVLALDLTGNHELDVQTIDTLADLAEALSAQGVELRVAEPHAEALAALRRAGVADGVHVRPSLDAATDVNRSIS